MEIFKGKEMDTKRRKRFKETVQEYKKDSHQFSRISGPFLKIDSRGLLLTG